VTLKRMARIDGEYKPGSERQILTTDYMAGAGHSPSYKQGRDNETFLKCQFECEHGIKAGLVAYLGRNTEIRPARPTQPIVPNEVDVIASLALDSNVLDESSFEDWASNLGYDVDSRKAEATYRACLDLALKLRNGLGDEGLRKLHEACQDY
jgi:hypothetical protein